MALLFRVASPKAVAYPVGMKQSSKPWNVPQNYLAMRMAEHPRQYRFSSGPRISFWLFMRSGVLRQENRKQGVQGCLAASSDVVQALKEGQVEGEFFLGNPPVWAQPGAQQ